MRSARGSERERERGMGETLYWNAEMEIARVRDSEGVIVCNVKCYIGP